MAPLRAAIVDAGPAVSTGKFADFRAFHAGEALAAQEVPPFPRAAWRSTTAKAGRVLPGDWATLVGGDPALSSSPAGLMDAEDHVRLLHGPYTPPALKVGERAMCLYRDAEVAVYAWSAARISWPLCYHVGTRAFGKGLLVDEELARAVRMESGIAVGHWWGVSRATVRKWRRVVGAGRKNNPGTQRLIHAAVVKASSSREIMQHKDHASASG